jgi:hypothetical protein
MPLSTQLKEYWFIDINREDILQPSCATRMPAWISRFYFFPVHARANGPA